MKEKKSISVVMATYNGETFLKEQLRSFERQTLLPDEIVICDDHSTDRTKDILLKYARTSSAPVCYQINENNLGYARNFFRAMSKASGDLLFLSDQDDVWASDKLQHMTQIMEKHPEILVLASSFTLIDKNGGYKRSLEDFERKGLHKVTWESFLCHPKYMGMLLAVRREVYERVLAREAKCGCGDWEELPHDWRLCEYAAERDGFYKTGEKLVYYRQHGGNTVGSVLNGNVDVRKRRQELIGHELKGFRVLKHTLKAEKKIDVKKSDSHPAHVTDELRINYLEDMIQFCEKRLDHMNEGSLWKTLCWNMTHLQFISFRAAIGDLFSIVCGSKC